MILKLVKILFSTKIYLTKLDFQTNNNSTENFFNPTRKPANFYARQIDRPDGKLTVWVAYQPLFLNLLFKKDEANQDFAVFKLYCVNFGIVE